tara:strand:- start:7 stop:465 length:459 start_codon:yes stop_codon:yes gene_type:complete
MEYKQKTKLEFQKDSVYEIELLFDNPKSGTTDKGNSWYLFGVKHDGEEKNFFADYDLVNELKKYGRGDVLEVLDSDPTDDPYKHKWSVSKVGGMKSSSSNDTEIKVSTWAGMKVASSFSKNIDELKANTYLVMELHKEICKSTKDEQELFND